MSNNALVNLHIHTFFSDGKRSTLDVFKGARDAGVSYFAITDHDTYVALSPDQLGYFSEKSFVTIPVESNPGVLNWEHLTALRGVELTFIHRGRQMHMIGLGLNYPGQDELDRCDELKSVRHNRIISLANEINQRNDGIYSGLTIELDELMRETKDSVPSRYHLGYLIAKKFPGMTTYHATTHYVAPNLESYAIQTDLLPDFKDAVNIIHSLGGVAILPHLGRNKLPGIGDGLEEEILFMYEHGLDGIEIQTGRGKQENVKINNSYLMMAHNLNNDALRNSNRKLLISLGSDDHGMYDSCEKLIGLSIPSGFSSMVIDIMERMKTYRA
jgi:3',5'-nucleoside bisphosphate phosphatase